MNNLKLFAEPCAGIELFHIKLAARNIAGYAHRTSVITSSKLDSIAGHQLFFKCENLQRAGAFKFRGAFNAIQNIPAEQRPKGVVTHSSGNHAGALALAAKLFGTRAFVVMPTNSNPVKRSAVEEYGGQVIPCEPNQAAREATCAQIQQETGATLIPPYDHPDIIAGQGTAALEMLQQVPNLDVLIAPVGGGGLLSGTAIAAKNISPRIRVIGAEPSGADDAYRSKQAGELIPQTNPQTIADGLRTSLGDLTWPIIRDSVQKIITVDEDTIVQTTRLFWERTKLLIETSSAVAVAAALYGKPHESEQPRNIGVILSGGNVDLNQLPW